jgi:hypothetical protein
MRLTNRQANSLGLVALGILAVIAAGAWYFLGQPSEQDQRSAEIRCAIWSDPAACEDDPLPIPTAGPIVLAITGGFLALAGVIVYAGAPSSPSPAPRRTPEVSGAAPPRRPSPPLRHGVPPQWPPPQAPGPVPAAASPAPSGKRSSAATPSAKPAV